MDEQTAVKLREQFPPALVGKLPRVTCGKCSDKNNRAGTCDEHPRKERCETCKAWVSPKHIHIDYVGHADVTSRLIEADPDWNWEPKAEDEHGLPLFDTDDRGNPVGLWIKLTVGGVTRLGYGSVPSNQSDAIKVLIGDALRNAAMRFGVALDLWAKGDRADPTAENATASAGQAARRGRQPQSAGEAFASASPPQGNGRQSGQPARNGNGRRQPAEADIDADAQALADEAHEARTVLALKTIHGKVLAQHKLSAIIRNPATGGIGGMGAYLNWRKKELEDAEAAWKELQDAAGPEITGEALNAHVQTVTGASIEAATAEQLRAAAKALVAA